MTKKLLLLGALALVVTAGAVALFVTPTEAAIVALPVDCSQVLCIAPDCPAGTKAVILPGDCCFTCVPTK